MKTVKNDTRYIIKRIIIGVGVALILAFINNNKVFADEINVYSTNANFSFTPQSGYNYVSLGSLKSPYSNNYYNFNTNLGSQLTSNQRRSYLILYNEKEDIYLYIFNNNYVYQDTLDMHKLKITWNSSYQYYTFQYGCDSSVSSSRPQCNADGWTSPIGGLSGHSTYLSNHIITDFSSLSDTPLNKYDSPVSGEYFYNIQDSVRFSTIRSIFTDFKYYDSNLSELVIDNQNIDLIPSGYSKIDLTGNEAVYFVPKNYNQVNIEHIDNVNYYDFNYYYTGSIKEGWFPLNNLNDLFLDDYMSNNTSIDEVSYRDSFFPMYEDPNDTALGYNYYAYIIFNNNQENSSIWYYSSQFDAYKITKIEEYNQNICYEDRTNEEMCIDINFSSFISNYWIQGFNDDNSSFSGEQEKSTNKLSNLFNFLKTPFSFLNSLKTYSCSTLSIPLPFINRNIQLNCLSSTFKRVLGDNFYNIIIYIITGFYAYRITIMNIDTLTDVLNPNDDKLEVVDL